MKYKILPIDSFEKELCFYCIMGLIYYPYMPPTARELYDTITEEEKNIIKAIAEENVKTLVDEG